MTFLSPELSKNDLPAAVTRRAYGRWSAVYDLLCGPLFRPAHRAAAAAANAVGGRILEVGVGTGLLLPLYRSDASVVGLDVSDEMLAKARARLTRRALPQVTALERGDIHALPHPAASYDAVVLPFVLTLLARPETALDNCRRLLKPGGEIIVVSHFRSETPWLAAIEGWLAPRLAPLGLRPDFPVARLERWARAHPDLECLAPQPVGALRAYTLLRVRRRIPTALAA